MIVALYRVEYDPAINEVTGTAAHYLLREEVSVEYDPAINEVTGTAAHYLLREEVK